MNRPDRLLRCKGGNAAIARPHLPKCYTITDLRSPSPGHPDPKTLDGTILNAIQIAEFTAFDPILVDIRYHTDKQIQELATVVFVFSGARRPHIPEQGGCYRAHC